MHMHLVVKGSNDVVSSNKLILIDDDEPFNGTSYSNAEPLLPISTDFNNISFLSN